MKKIIKLTALSFLTLSIYFVVKQNIEYSLLSAVVLLMTLYINLVMEENAYFAKVEKQIEGELMEIEGELYDVVDRRRVNAMFDEMASDKVVKLNRGEL